MRRLSQVDRDELKITFTIIFFLEYRCFTILRQFLLYKEVNQLNVYISPLPPEPPSHLRLTHWLITELVTPEKAQDLHCLGGLGGLCQPLLPHEKEGPLFE